MDEQIFNAIDEWIKKYRSRIGYSVPVNEKLPFTLTELTYWMMNTKEQEFNRLPAGYYAIALLLAYQTKSGFNLMFQILSRKNERIPRSVDYYVFSSSEYGSVDDIQSTEIVDQYLIRANWDLNKIDQKIKDVYNIIVKKTTLSNDEIENAFKVNTKLRRTLLSNITAQDKFFNQLTTHTINIGNKKVYLKTEPITLPRKLNKTGETYEIILDITMDRHGYSDIKLCNVIKSTKKIKTHIWRLIVENGQFIDYSIVVKNMDFWFSYDNKVIKIVLPVELQLIKAKDYGQTIGALLANLSHISQLKSDTQKLNKLQELADQLGVSVDKFTEADDIYNYLDDYIMRLNYDDFDVQTS